MTKIKDIVLDGIWNAASLGLGCMIQTPIEVIKYTSAGITTVNGKKYPEIGDRNDMRKVMDRLPKDTKMVSIGNTGPQVRRMIVFR